MLFRVLYCLTSRRLQHMRGEPVQRGALCLPLLHDIILFLDLPLLHNIILLLDAALCACASFQA
jgi:hypothetical protein